MEPHQQQLLTVEQAAHALGVGRTKVFALVGSGAISSVRIGRRRLIPREALTEFVTDLRRAPGKAHQ